MPVMPVKLAGWRIEPPVSVPVAAGTSRAATAAAEPPEEPPGTRLSSHGFRTGRKAEFSFKWTDSINDLTVLKNRDDRKAFLLNLICFAACNEGMFFFAAFAYVYYLRSKGLLHGLATGTNWVFRDESMHMQFAFSVIDTIREEEPELFDDDLTAKVYEMIEDAIECETMFANDVLAQGVAGLSVRDMRTYLEFVADRRLAALRMPIKYGSKNPFSFLDLQDVQEVTNFFERRVSSYSVGVEGSVAFNETF